jgi:c-di-GMP-binding flagellar brake protein YcgR
MLDMFSDRRSSKRVDKNLEAEYELLDGGVPATQAGFKKSITRNISLGGICMIVNSKLEAGDVIRVNLDLSGSDKKVNAFCNVEWCRREQDGWLAGISFISLGEDEAGHIGSYIEDYN